MEEGIEGSHDVQDNRGRIESVKLGAAVPFDLLITPDLYIR